jgi:hypothetical protein
MNIQDTNFLNKYLQNLSHGNSINYPVYIDSLRTAFIITENEYILPNVSLHGIDKDTTLEYLKQISPFLRNQISSFQVFPDAWPRRDINKLILMKEFSILENKFIYMWKFECGYLGGSARESFITPATQKYSPSVKTNRIYFSIRIFQVTNVRRINGQINGFEPMFLDRDKYIEMEDTYDKKVKIYSELFDDLDYSSTLDPVKNILNINSDNWKLGKIYDPIIFENLVPSIRFLQIDVNKNIQEFTKFYKILDYDSVRQNKIDSETLRNFKEWLSIHNFEKSSTLSNNNSWKIII